jgi:hypothetical protein
MRHFLCCVITAVITSLSMAPLPQRIFIERSSAALAVFRKKTIAYHPIILTLRSIYRNLVTPRESTYQIGEAYGYESSYFRKGSVDDKGYT